MVVIAFAATVPPVAGAAPERAEELATRLRDFVVGFESYRGAYTYSNLLQKQANLPEGKVQTVEYRYQRGYRWIRFRDGEATYTEGLYQGILSNRLDRLNQHC